MGIISVKRFESACCLLIDFHSGDLATIKLQGTPIQLTRDSHAKAQLQKKNRVQDNIGSRTSFEAPACPCLNQSRPSRHPSRRINQSTIGPSTPSLAESRSGPDMPPASSAASNYPDVQDSHVQHRLEIDICPSEASCTLRGDYKLSTDVAQTHDGCLVRLVTLDITNVSRRSSLVLVSMYPGGGSASESRSEQIS